MAFDCSRCWNTGVYFAPEFRRFLRCTVCNSNFADPRTGPELAAALDLSEIPFSDSLGFYDDVASVIERNDFTRRYIPYIEAELEKGREPHA